MSDNANQNIQLPSPEMSTPLIHGNSVLITGGTFNQYLNLQAVLLKLFEQAVNHLARNLMLEQVILTPEFSATIQWKELPPGFSVHFLRAVALKYRGFPLLEATAGRIASDDASHDVPLLLLPENRGRFKTFASDILRLDKVNLKLQSCFSFEDIEYELDATMSLDGLDSFKSDAITLDNVKILGQADNNNLRASVDVKIRNRTRIEIAHVKVKSSNILYHQEEPYVDNHSTSEFGSKIGYHKDEKFKLLRGLNPSITFSWMFTPPHASHEDNDFRTFISTFLTTEKIIPISLDLEVIEIMVGDQFVELKGVKVKTSIKGIKQPLVTQVDVYLGLSVLRRDVSFRLKLENPIDAPIQVLGCEVDAKLNGKSLSRFPCSFTDLAIEKSKGEKESEVVTAKLNSLLGTIYHVGMQTEIFLNVNIERTQISIDGVKIDNLDFELKGVKSRIHFGPLVKEVLCISMLLIPAFLIIIKRWSVL